MGIKGTVVFYRKLQLLTRGELLVNWNIDLLTKAVFADDFGLTV